MHNLFFLQAETEKPTISKEVADLNTKYKKEDCENAISKVLKGEMSMQMASKLYNVPYQVIMDKVIGREGYAIQKGPKRMRTVSLYVMPSQPSGSQVVSAHEEFEGRLFNARQEQILVKHITKAKNPFSYKAIRQLAGEMAFYLGKKENAEPLSISWLQGFF